MIGSPRISAIIPVYNAEQYIVKCLDTVLAQGFDDFEVIAINDCSKDNSRSILDSYAQKDNRIRCIHLEKNGGVSHARNLGISLAKGDYVTFIDADDFIDTDYFGNAFPNDEKDFDIIISGLKVGADADFSITMPQEEVFYNIKDFSTAYPVLDHSGLLRLGPYNKFYKRSLLSGAGIAFPYFSFGEDQCFILMCLKQVSSVRTRHYAGYYYVRKKQSSLSRGVHTQHSYNDLSAFLEMKFSLKNELLALMGLPPENNEQFHENNLLAYVSRIFALYSPKTKKNAKERRSALKENRREPWMKYYKASDFGKKFNLMKWPLIYIPIGIADPLLNRLFKIWYAKR